MAVGFPAKTSWASGDVLTAAGIDDLAGTLNLLQKLYTGLYSLLSPKETMNIVASGATGTINVDAKTSCSWYYTSSAAANFTLNFRGDGTTTLDSLMSTGESLTIVFLNTNGATPYYANTIKIDSNTVTPKWSGGTAPAAGNASAIDAYSFTIIKRGSATFDVIASQVKCA